MMFHTDSTLFLTLFTPGRPTIRIDSGRRPPKRAAGRPCCPDAACAASSPAPPTGKQPDRTEAQDAQAGRFRNRCRLERLHHVGLEARAEPAGGKQSLQVRTRE